MSRGGNSGPARANLGKCYRHPRHPRYCSCFGAGTHRHGGSYAYPSANSRHRCHGGGSFGGNCGGNADGHAGPNGYSYTGSDANTNPYCYANTHTDSDRNPNPNCGSDSHTYTDLDAAAHFYACPNEDATSYLHAQSNEHAFAAAEVR